MSFLWTGYILVMVILGGLLVIFVYVSLVATNEAFSLDLKQLLLLSIRIGLIFLIYSKILTLPQTTPIEKLLAQDSLNWTVEFYSASLAVITIFTVFYLLLTLILVVYNTKRTKITLRGF